MTRPAPAPVVLVLASVALALAATWLSFDNPDIDNTSRGDDYTCLAPWDTALNGADNFPGGETPLDGEEIAARCRQAGQERWEMALVAGSFAIALGVLAAGLSWRGTRTAAAPRSRVQDS